MRSFSIRYLITFILCSLVALSLAGCNLPRSEATPTELNVTQAYETIQAKLTLAVQPTTPTPTSELSSPTPPATPPTVTPTRLPTATAPTATSRITCDLAAPGNPIDVTIPDDTGLQPSQSFTKVWRLQNSGTCTWSKAYAVAFFSGDQMGAPASVNLAGDVAPGQSVDIAVDMVAPNKAGKYQGNWKMRNASNVLFGIGPGGSAPFWVRIVVALTSTPTSTPRTPTPTATSPAPTATATATQPVYIMGTASLNVSATLDLDADQINTPGADVAYAEDGNGKHQLNPQSSALLGVYGGGQPGQANCQASAIGTAPVVVEDTPTGTYLCYRTDQGRYGRLRLSNFDAENFTVTLEFLTWP
jgi:hypothetical protein